MVYSFPTNERTLGGVCRIRAESLKAEQGGVEATEFYGSTRESMDVGAKWLGRPGSTPTNCRPSSMQ